ncbi:MAG: OsmC family protein [Elusimicrobia bacterium]|nr:OsmC family protein [Elusimicrobiota bacterium]MDE2512321.1 OsmC family protein [Elusimicrobiota bacterium]
MVKMSAVYEGNLRCALTHQPSGARLETDAPKDNMGKGERFSPTDLVGAAFAGCVLTTMAIVAQRDGVELRGARAEVSKEMISAPSRRVGALPLTVTLSASIPADYRAKLENAARTCPVHKSLHPDLKAEITFVYA